MDIEVDNGSVMVDAATVTTTDIDASNGVIHVIDAVMMPTSETIVGVADQAGSFKTLIAAVKAAGLAEALMGDGPYTVFAPTDDAFAKLPEGTVASLLEEENRGKLQAILKYHVVPGRVFSNAVVKQKRIETLAGAQINISVDGGKARANESIIVATDIDATNGVIHVIDSVLLPPAEQSSMLRCNRLIEMAIHRGAPMYNHGNAAACAAVYEMTAEALLQFHSDLPESAQAALQDALNKMQCTRNADEQAWIMRRALDAAHQAVQMELAGR